MTWPDRILKWIEPEDNPADAVCDTLAAGLVIAAEDPTTAIYPRVLTATVVAVATYWLAHGYADQVGQRFRRHAHDRNRLGEFIGALGPEWPLAEGAAVPLTVLLVSWAAGAPLTTGVPAAIWTAAATLVMFDTAAGAQRRLPAAQLLANAAIGLAFGAALLG